MDDIIDTLIGQNTKIKGDIEFSGSIRIVGFFEKMTKIVKQVIPGREGWVCCQSSSV